MSKSGHNAKAQAARLAAVQALYEYSQNNRDPKMLAADYASQNQPVEGEALVPPDAALLKKILFGAVDRLEEMEGAINVHWSPKGGTEKGPEPLLKAILICGAYELMVHQDTDFPIIINDYVNVTHAFYNPAEAGLVNAVLDKIARQVRT